MFPASNNIQSGYSPFVVGKQQQRNPRIAPTSPPFTKMAEESPSAPPPPSAAAPAPPAERKSRWDAPAPAPAEGAAPAAPAISEAQASEAAAKAAAIAAKIAASLRPPGTQGNEVARRAGAVDEGFVKDIEINDLRNRYVLTRAATQKQVSRERVQSPGWRRI
jgi:hypothetical protein